jgi:hypothetical protein
MEAEVIVGIQEQFETSGMFGETQQSYRPGSAGFRKNIENKGDS